jgi:hypothetical protein
MIGVPECHGPWAALLQDLIGNVGVVGIVLLMQSDVQSIEIRMFRES